MLHKLGLMAVFIFSGSSRTEEAAELYTKAGNTFKMAKKWAGKSVRCSLHPCCMH